MRFHLCKYYLDEIRTLDFTADPPAMAPEAVIVRAAQALDSRHAKLSQVGIQFVQVGHDDAAREFLESLDDTLRRKHNIRVSFLVLLI